MKRPALMMDGPIAPLLSFPKFLARSIPHLPRSMTDPECALFFDIKLKSSDCVGDTCKQNPPQTGQGTIPQRMDDFERRAANKLSCVSGVCDYTRHGRETALPFSPPADESQEALRVGVSIPVRNLQSVNTLIDRDSLRAHACPDGCACAAKCADQPGPLGSVPWVGYC